MTIILKCQLKIWKFLKSLPTLKCEKASKHYSMSTSLMVIVNLSLNHYVNPAETTRQMAMFSHYYHIWRPNVAEQVLRIHLFFLDATQLDPETGSYNVYSKKTRPVAWKGRKTDYTGSLGKELSFVVVYSLPRAIKGSYFYKIQCVSNHRKTI